MCYDMDDDDMYFEFEGEKLEDDEEDEEENYPWIYDVQEVDVHDELVNSAYDESGNAVPCSMCPGEMKWSPSKRVWYCPECDYEFDREDFSAILMQILQVLNVSHVSKIILTAKSIAPFMI